MELPVMQRLRRQLEELKRELTTTLPKELEAARAHGDLRENAEYEACKERQGYLTLRIGQIDERLRQLSIHSIQSIPDGAVGYGSRVTLENVDDGKVHEYELALPEEADAAAGRISVASPLGRALLQKEVGDEVEVQTPRGKKALPDRYARDASRT